MGQSSKGFTLVEVLCAITILSFAMIFIFRGLLTSASALDEIRDRLNILGRFHDTITQARISVWRGDIPPNNSKSGKVEAGGKTFYYDVRMKRVRRGEGLYMVAVTYRWFKGRREARMSREFLCLREPEG